VAVAAFLALMLTRGAGPGAAVFDVAGHPTGLVVTEDAVWVAMPGSGAVRALHPVSGRQLGAPLRTGGAPTRLAAGAAGLWVSDTARGAVIPIQHSPSKVYGAIAIGSDVTDLELAAGALWVASSAEGVVRIVESGGRPVLSAPVGADPVDVAAGGRWVVVAGAGSGSLTRFDARTRRRVGGPIVLGGVPVAAAVTGDVAWVADSDGGTVRRVDLLTGRPGGAPIQVGRRPIAVAADGQDVFVLSRGDRTLVHADGDSGEVLSRRPVGPDPAALALARDHVWVADSGNDTLMRFAR